MLKGFELAEAAIERSWDRSGEFSEMLPQCSAVVKKGNLVLQLIRKTN